MKTLFIIAVIYCLQFASTMTSSEDTAPPQYTTPGTATHEGEEHGNYRVETSERPTSDNITNSGLLIAQHERCRRTKKFGDCFKFRLFKFANDLFDSVTFGNLSEILKTRGMRSEETLVLARLPSSDNFQFGFGKKVQRAFRSSSSVEIFRFIAEELDRYLSRHGLVITVRNMEDGEPPQSDSPWLIDFEQSKDDGTSRKVKKKEYAVVFPMLVLFKFLKIKMLLVPILLGVVFLKKLLIITLTLLPYLVGLFGCCRRAPFLGQVQSAGILQEVDTRGEFASNLGYSFPYREEFSYRQKDKSRPSDIYSDY